MTILGIDIGGTKTAVVLGNAKGETYGRQQFTTDPVRGFDAFFAELLTVVAAVREQSRVPIHCASVSVGGPLDEERGVLIGPPHLTGWIDIPLVERLREALGLPIYMMHDARACAFAEFYFGAGRQTGARNMAFMTFATGFGLGMVLNGRLMDFPGEVGHWRVAEDGPEMFGKVGSLEGLASGAGMAEHAALTGQFTANVTVEQLTRSARDGDYVARGVIDAAAEQVGRQCARLIDLFGVELIALGTIAVHAEDLFLETIRETMREEALAHLGARCKIVSAGLGNRLGDMASLAAAIHHGYRDQLRMGPSVGSQLRKYCALAEAVHADVELVEKIDEAALRVVRALEKGGKILTCGNGGSATDAAHLAEELIGRFRNTRRALPAVNLCADGAALTCIANDFGFDEIFARQVAGLGVEDDVLVAFTTSGNSPNINHALEIAHKLGLFTIALTGKTGGEAAKLADLEIRIPHQASERIQEIHTFVLHAMCEAVEHAFLNAPDREAETT